MRLVIDADACPVVETAVTIAAARNVPVIAVCDTAHEIHIPNAEVIQVSRGADSADFRIVNLLQPGDVVVTQDYGLAAMCMGRNATVLHQDGMEYTQENIDGLLWQRHTAREARMAGIRTKGPKKRQKSQNIAFAEALGRILDEMLASGRE